MKIQAELLGLLLLALGCTDKNESPAPATEKSMVEFTLSSINTDEGTTQIEILIHLDRPAVSTGRIKLSLAGSAVYGADFTTVPESDEGQLTLDLTEGDETVAFKVYTLEDAIVDGNKTVSFTISNTSKNLASGQKKSLSLHIADIDENPIEEQLATVEFVTDQAQMMEDKTSGYQILLSVSAIVDHTEHIFIDLTSEDYVYGADYFTEPMSVDGSIRLDVLPGQTEINLHLFPINNNVVNDIRNIAFSITSVSDGLLIGEISTFNLAVEDDDIPSGTTHSIYELREYFDEHTGDWYISEDYYIEGVITSAGNVPDSKHAYIQDETGGILLIFDSPNLYPLGNKVRLNLKNGTGEMVNNQKAIMGVEDRAGTVLGTGITIAPMEINLEQYYSGAYQGMRVKISNLTLAENTNTAKWLGTRRFYGPDGRYINVTTNRTAEFSDFFVPTRVMNIIGIAGGWSWLEPQTVADFAFY